MLGAGWYSRLAEFVERGAIEVEGLSNLVWAFRELQSMEKELQKRIDRATRRHPLRVFWLDKVKGVGAVLAGAWIAYLVTPERFSNVSKLWAYCGLAPGQGRRKGEKLNYNPKLKTLAYKTWTAMIKVRDSFGRKLYEESKALCQQKHPDWTKMHVHLWAGRRVAKIFLACLWAKWREIEGLPVTQPYPIQFLGHTDIITPEDWVQK